MLSWLYKKQQPEYEKIRKDIKKLSKHVLTIPYDGKEYKLYELSTIHDMPAKRYQVMMQFIEDARMNIEKEELAHYMQELEDLLKKAAKDDPDSFANALILTKWMKARTKISLDIDLVMRVLSACFFLEDEDPLDYDWDINDFKIKMFEKSGVSAFFLTEPMIKYLRLIGISNVDMEVILRQQKTKRQVLKELNQMGISVYNIYKAE